MTYKNRNDANKINQLLEMFPAVVILGVRQGGKTTLAKQLRPDWIYVDLEKGSDFNQISYDTEFFFEQHPHSIIIDEAQCFPKIFEILRGVIDQNRTQSGRFIITGSSSPDILNHVSESLAGRVALVSLGTLKANEIYDQPISHFYQLFEQPLNRHFLDDLPSPHLTNSQIQTTWLRGGYPEPIFHTNPSFYLQWMENYEKTYIYRDIARLFPNLNKIAFQRFLTMLSRLSSSILNKSDLARALEVSEGSVRHFLKIVEGTFLWRELPSYEHSVIKSTVKMPKGYIRDSGLLNALLNIHNAQTLYQDPIVGHSFEGFVIEEILKALDASLLTHWDPYYYRTRGGAEIDLILKGPFGVLPIEIKYGSSTQPKQLKQLETFIQDNQLDFGLIINQAEKATWLSRYVFQLPASYL